MRKNVVDTGAYNSLAVVGAGAWGTALAAVAARDGRSVTLWAMEPEVVSGIRDDHVNARFLPGVALPGSIVATGELDEATKAEAICWLSRRSICGPCLAG